MQKSILSRSMQLIEAFVKEIYLVKKLYIVCWNTLLTLNTIKFNIFGQQDLDIELKSETKTMFINERQPLNLVSLCAKYPLKSLTFRLDI